MELTLDIDDFGRLVSTLSGEGAASMVTASNVPAALEDLKQALEDAASSGYGECIWQEANGDYRWILRRDADRMTVAIMWSRGTVTGWEHVFRAEDEFEPLAGRMRDEFGRLLPPS